MNYVSMPYLLLLIVVDDGSSSRYSQGPLTERTGPVRVIWSNHFRTWVVEKHFWPKKQEAGEFAPVHIQVPGVNMICIDVANGYSEARKSDDRGRVRSSGQILRFWFLIVVVRILHISYTFSWQQCGMVLSCWTPIFSMRGDSFTPVNR